MTNQELCEEIKAIRDLAERLADKMDELNLRLDRGGGKTDYVHRVPIRMRDDEDNGSD